MHHQVKTTIYITYEPAEIVEKYLTVHAAELAFLFTNFNIDFIKWKMETT